MTLTDLCYMLASTASSFPSSITQAYNVLVANAVDWMLNGIPNPFSLPSFIEFRRTIVAIPAPHAARA